MFNPAISVTRVISMLLILLAHFFTWKNINTFQIASIGVAAFLFISGYLCGMKDIDDKKKWFAQRIIRVLLPFWILSATLSIYLFIEYDKKIAFFSFLETFFNLQGIHFIFHESFKLGNYHIDGLSHCWFLTIIMMCYFFVAIIKNNRIEKIIEHHIKKVFAIVCLLHFFFALLNISIGVFIIFFVGYFFQRIMPNEKHISVRILAITVSLSLLFFLLRLLLKRYIDGSLIYDNFVASVSTNVCAIGFVIMVRVLCQMKINLAKAISQSCVWKKIDEMTFPIYLTHYIFLHEPFEIHIFSHLLLQIIMFALITIVSAVLLNKISMLVKNIIIQKKLFLS